MSESTGNTPAVKLVSISIWVPEEVKKRVRHLAVERNENGYSKTSEYIFMTGLDMVEQLVADQADEQPERRSA